MQCLTISLTFTLHLYCTRTFEVSPYVPIMYISVKVYCFCLATKQSDRVNTRIPIREYLSYIVTAISIEMGVILLHACVHLCGGVRIFVQYNCRNIKIQLTHTIINRSNYAERKRTQYPLTFCLNYTGTSFRLSLAFCVNSLTTFVSPSVETLVISQCKGSDYPVW